MKDNLFYAYAASAAALKLAPTRKAKPLSDAGAKAAFENCIYSDSFEACADSCGSVLFIIDKSFAEETAADLLGYMIGVAEKGGKKIGLIDLSSSAAVAEKYADKLISREPENMNAHAFYGVTKARTPVMLHKAYLEHDLIVAAGRVAYDTLIGYTGGCSLIFPALAPVKSLVRNNLAALDFSGGLLNPYVKARETTRNPLNRDRVDAVMITRSGRTLFGVNLLADDEGALTGLVCGDLFMAHRKACEILDEVSLIDAEKPHSSVVASCPNLSIDGLLDLVQNLSEICAEGGDMVIITDNILAGNTDAFALEEDVLKSKVEGGAGGIYYKALRFKQLIKSRSVYLCGAENRGLCGVLGLKNLPDADGLSELVDADTLFLDGACGKAFRLKG